MAEPRRGATIACSARSATVTRLAGGARSGAKAATTSSELRRSNRELVGQLSRQEAEGGVELVGGEKAEHVAGDALAQADLDARVRSTEAREQPGDVEAAGRQQRSDPDAPPQDAAQLVDLLARGVDLREHAARSRGEGVSRLGGHDAAAGALEERRAELALEPLDLVGERRLGDVELRCGAGEVAVARDRFDASQLSELHGNDRRSRSLR